MVAAMLAVIGPAAVAAGPAKGKRGAFYLQAHRGGIGLVVESTIPAFANALELGVSTLELDVQITEDGQAVVTQDRRISNRTCRTPVRRRRTTPSTPT